MRSRYWTFVEQCDEAHTVRAVKDLLGATLREQGIESYAIMTHVHPRDLGSLGVLVHTWPSAAIDHVFQDGSTNPLFEVIEASPEPVVWSSPTWRAGLRRDQRAWLQRLQALVPGEGVTMSLRSPLVSASCSLTASRPFQRDQIRLCRRIATCAYQTIQALQRPQVREADRLTQREHECLYRAAILGERPSAVAKELGVKVSTVRTHRRKAYGRLGADSPEQALWRMMETGQLFQIGRKTRRRS